MSDTSPATKEDVKMLMESIGHLYSANEQWKNEILDANEGWKEEIINEFHIVADTIRHDVGGAQSDRIAGVENRVTRLEQHTGIAV